MVALTFGALAYLSKRMIEDNDLKHRETMKSVSVIASDIRVMKAKVTLIDATYNKILENGFPARHTASTMNDALKIQEIKNIESGLATANLGISRLQRDVSNIIPKVEANGDYIGEVVWIKEEIHGQNKKMRAIFDIISTLAKNQKH